MPSRLIEWLCLLSGLTEDLGDIQGVLRREKGKLAAQNKRQKAENRNMEAALTEEIDALKQKKIAVRYGELSLYFSQAEELESICQSEPAVLFERGIF